MGDKETERLNMPEVVTGFHRRLTESATRETRMAAKLDESADKIDELYTINTELKGELSDLKTMLRTLMDQAKKENI